MVHGHSDIDGKDDSRCRFTAAVKFDVNNGEVYFRITGRMTEGPKG